MKKEQGTLILFPSYTLHEVKPVTKGERNSLVTWVTGKSFKWILNIKLLKKLYRMS